MYGTGQPDLVVAIDFGMTCTGVAYANLSTRSDHVYFIQKWPGRAQASENKVPTSVVYSKPDRRPIAWGFASDAAYEQAQGFAEYREWFKILLDPAELLRDQENDPEGAPQSMEEVESYYEDYLRLLCNHIESELSVQLYGKSWHDASIEFIFSLPTTWADKSIVERFRTLILKAGFTSSPRHTVDIGLTEAEAAAVQVSKRDKGVFRHGDVILVCDAGGGTTDLSVLQVAGIWNDILSLRQLDVVQGRTIGSASIDADFERLARQTLQIARETQPFEMTDSQLHEQSWAMMKSSDYQNMKCEFGSKAASYFTTFSVPAKKLPPSYNNTESRISEQSVMFDRSDFQELFDKQLRKLFDLIDHQLQDVETKLPGERITHLVLSGGLGNSPYVLQQLKARYEMGSTSRFPSTEWLQVRAAPEPQMAVCKGIVEDRVQKLSSGQAVLSMRCCRESYGVACKELYDALNPSHTNRRTAIDEADGRLYVVDGVDWFIKAGDPVSSDNPIVHNFFRTIPENDTARIFNTTIYVSRSPDTRSLPNYLAPGAEIYQLCNVVSNLQSFSVDQFEAKGRQPWSRKKPHWLVRYQIQAIIGPGDLRFELWFNGNKVNVDHAIDVEWFAAPELQTSTQTEVPRDGHQPQPQFSSGGAYGPEMPRMTADAQPQLPYPSDQSPRPSQLYPQPLVSFPSNSSLHSQSLSFQTASQSHPSTPSSQVPYSPSQPVQTSPNLHQPPQPSQASQVQYQTFNVAQTPHIQYQPFHPSQSAQVQYQPAQSPQAPPQLQFHPPQPQQTQYQQDAMSQPSYTQQSSYTQQPPYSQQTQYSHQPPYPQQTPYLQQPYPNSTTPMPGQAPPAPAATGSSAQMNGKINIDMSNWKAEFKSLKGELSKVKTSMQNKQQAPGKRMSFFKT